MSIRLNVVVVQSPRMTSLQVGIIADIVIQLLGRPGIDVAMVTSLEPDDEHSTDRLMLAGLENDLAVIDWRSAEQTIASLESLGVNACQAPHSLNTDVQAVAPGNRRVYVFDLRNGFKANQVVQALIKLLEQRQVVTVSLLAPQQATMTDNGHMHATPAKSLTPMVTSSISPSHLPIKPQGRSVVEHSPLETSTGPTIDDADLEALVDSLNDIDL